MPADSKTKRPRTEFIVENIDNRASVSTIVAAIAPRSGKQKVLGQYITRVARQRLRSSHFFILNDFLFPSQPRNAFSADWDGDLNSGFFEHLPVKSLMPWYITGAQNIGKCDPVVELLKQKQEWNTVWSQFKASTSSKRKWYHKWYGEDVIYCPKTYINMAEHLTKLPDPYFSESYNWYYAGVGNLQVTRLQGNDYIMHSEFDCLYVSPYSRDTLAIDYENGASYKCPGELTILETAHSEHFIALRTKCKIIIVQVTTAELPLQLHRLKEIDSELPFTSAKFDDFHKNILYVTTLDYKLTIVNLTRMAGRSVKLRGRFATLADNWSMVLGGDRFNYTHLSRTAVTLYDKRTNQPHQRLKTLKYLTDTQDCCQITAVKYCDGKPLMYLATEHNLFLMDMRAWSTRADSIKAVQRWTHGMMCPPLYIDVCPGGRDRELVCLTSQWVEDMCVVSNHSDTLTRLGEIPGMSVPYRPPNVLETFNEANQKKMCYSSFERIRRRLCTSISGMAIVKRGDNTNSIIMQNSLGDISCHALYPKNMCAFIEDDSVEKLHVWCQAYKEDISKFEVSYVLDIRVTLKNLRIVPEDYELGKNAIITPIVKFNEEEIQETFASEQIDPEFLEIWKDKPDEITLDDTNAVNESQFFTG